MSDALLQFLLLLTYLMIGLISVSFPIFAIAIVYLPKEKWETEKERSRRIEGLKGKIAKLTTELEGRTEDTMVVDQLTKQLSRYEIELKGGGIGNQIFNSKRGCSIACHYFHSRSSNH